MMTPENNEYWIQLNQLWEEIFGHTYSECYQLSLLPGPLGVEHQKHIAYIEKNAQPSTGDIEK